ncbi:PD40 domain-containing protein [Williamsia sp. 1135]|uniref:nSTAND1 domain-containing NTPase n=1 Tax=Williamsia sp. 1135 TaxID=1889262 RepID=UPI000A11EC33|nr:hypothetical protein BFL43_26010 [Williamsia sp. 1135]
MDEPTQHPVDLRDARHEFAVRFRALYDAAGSPPLKTVASRATATLLSSESRRPGSVSAQRLSDWRTGKTVPAKFDGLAATLRVLIAAARKRKPEPPIIGLYSISTWQSAWNSAITAPASSEKNQFNKTKPTDSDICPYPGLTPISENEADFYFGRSDAVSTLVEKFTDNIGTGRLTFLVGASGSGKSSLLQAGFSVRISGEYSTVSMTPGSEPTRTLRRVIDPDTRTMSHVLIVDQFEEVFTSCDEKERLAFIDAITELVDARPLEYVGVVVAVRADFYHQCVDLPVLGDSLVHNQMVLGRMSRQELTSAIVGPAHAVGLTVADGLVEVILSDLGIGSPRPTAVPTAPGVLPLLAHALQRTWEARTGNTLTLTGYRESGGVHGAITMSAEEKWSGFTEPQRDVARDLLLQLIHLGDDGRGTRRHLRQSELVSRHPDAATVMEALGAARLVIHDEHGTALAHEAVIEAWPRLSQWLGDDREDVLHRQRIEADAREWTAEGKDRSLLYRGTRLASVIDWHRRSRTALSPTTTAFLMAARAYDRRGTHLRRAMVVLLAALTLTTAVVAVGAFNERRQADEDRSDAQYNALLSEAARAQSEDPTVAARLALAAQDERPGDPRARTLLLASQTAALATVVDGHEGAVYDVATNTEGLVASASYDRTVRLWHDDGSGRPSEVGRPLSGHRSWITSVEFSGDGKTLFSADGDGVVRIWDVHTPGGARAAGKPLIGHQGAVYQVAVRPEADGTTKWIATAGDDHTARLWDLNTGRSVVLARHQDAIRSLAFSSDGDTLVTGSDDETAIVWDTTVPEQAHQIGTPLAGYGSSVHAVGFSPDATRLATGSDDQTLRVWSMTDRAKPVLLGSPIEAHNAAIWSLAFNGDGSQLATASWDGTAKVWSLSDPERPALLGQPLTGSSGGLTTLAFAGVGNRLITGGQDGALRFWSVPTANLAGHTRRVATPVFDASGAVMATGSRDGNLRLWTTTPVEGPLSTAMIPTTGAEVENIALSPDGTILAWAGLGTGEVMLWDVTDSHSPHPLGTPLRVSSRYTHELAFSPDSMTLATAADDQSIQLWNLSDRSSPQPSGSPLMGPAGWINAVRFSPDGHRLAAASSDKNLHIWNIQNGGPVSEVRSGHTGPVNSVAFSPNSRWVATGSDDQTIRLWSLDRTTDPVKLMGHESTVRSVSFDPTGLLLASGSDDQTVRLWDVRDPDHPQAVGESLSPAGTVRWKVAFSPDGHSLTAGGETGALRWWDYRTELGGTRICPATEGSMTTDQWSELLPGIPYRPTCGDR